MTSGAVAAATSPRQAAAGCGVPDGGRPRAVTALAVAAGGLAVVAPWLPPVGHLAAVAVLAAAALACVRRPRRPSPTGPPRVRSVAPPTEDDLLVGLVGVLGRSTQLSSVVVHTDEADPVHWGTPAGLPTVVALRHRGEHVGDLEMTGPVPRPTVLEPLAALVAAAVSVTGAAAEIDRVRARLAQVRLEERQVVRRQVHDGLGPALAGIRLGLRGARNLLAEHPEAGRELLAHLQGEVDLAVEAVGTLAHDLLPPVLEELGLVPALRELVQRYADDRGPVTLDAGPVGVLDPRTAATAYTVASEALAGVVERGGSTGCRLVVRSVTDQLVVELTTAPGDRTVARAVLPLRCPPATGPGLVGTGL